jgi:hypothetical protein
VQLSPEFHAWVAVAVVKEPPISKASLAQQPLASQEGRCTVKLFVVVACGMIKQRQRRRLNCEI